MKANTSKTNKASTKSNKSGMSTKAKVAIGAGVAAASAGAYYFLGPKGKKHQGEVKKFVVKMEKEVKAQAVKVKDMTEPMYHDIVDALEKKYSEEYKEHQGDIKAVAKALKSNWGMMKKSTQMTAKKVTSKVSTSSKQKSGSKAKTKKSK